MSLEALIALIIFLLLPEVEIGISKSSFKPIAWICLEKISSKLKSLPIDVMEDIFSESEIAGNGFLAFSNLPTNSATIWLASLALPPFPHISILFPDLTKLSKSQAEYIGVNVNGPYKKDEYRY